MVDQHTNETFSFVESEHQVLAFWQEHHVFEQSLKQTQSGQPYVFYDGPPFATGLPHHGHLLASTIKDIIPRYFTMKGYHVPRRFGWDCHGLPIEHEIDKLHGKSTDEIVAEQGVSGYNQACRDIVQRYASQWRQTITRLGRWVDFDNDYKTMQPDFMESVWWVFKQIWDKDYIYHGTKVVPFSTALGTVLSNFEAGSNYQDVQDPAVTVLFKLKDDPRYCAIWTTTPWTLPSNLGIAVNANTTYVTVHDKSLDKRCLVAKERVEAVFQGREHEILDECSGADLAGLTYEPLFKDFIDWEQSGAFKIVADDFVTTQDGTGLVHCAPAFGEDDHRVLQILDRKDFPCPIDFKGCFTDAVKAYEGEYIKTADKQIIKDIKNLGQLFDHKTCVHSYPFCPRSDTPLIYRTIPSWYIKVEAVKQQLLNNNDQIHWVPGHIQHGRFGKWLEGARDWAISRNRVWGTPLPVWINDTTDNRYCVGSIKELETLTGQSVTDLHRDHVDHLTFTLPNEEGTYHRVEEVLDCWFESGSMPYAQSHYPFVNKTAFEQAFPADFIAEGLDQTRGWFYTLTVLSTLLFDKPAFQHVIVNGIVMAEDGKKMSKRLKNYTAPDELMEQHGADALRLYLMNSGLVKGEEQRFTDGGVKDMVRRTLLPWHNAFKFLHTYASIDQWSPDQHMHAPQHLLDRWILSRLQSLKHFIKEHMEHYELYRVVPELLAFLEDLTNTYIRLNRSRFWTEALDDDKCQAYSTLYRVILEFTTCMAPFAPFLSETIYQSLLKLHSDNSNKPQSVHLCTFPTHDESMQDASLEEAVLRLQHILALGRQQRNALKIKVKIPLRELVVIHKDQQLLQDIAQHEATIQKELNVKSIRYDHEEDRYISLYAKPNSPVLGKRLGKSFGQYRQLIQNLSHEAINSLEKTGSITLEDETFSSDDILIFRESQADSHAVTDRFITIAFDETLDQALIDEGLAREVINRIQKTRKAEGLNVDDRITISYTASSHLLSVIEKHQTTICQETLCEKLDAVSEMTHQPHQFEIEEETLTITLHKQPCKTC